MKFMEKLSLSNYTAISVLEKLGLLNPSQEQIDVIESLVLIAKQPQRVTHRAVKRCVGNNKLACAFLVSKHQSTV